MRYPLIACIAAVATVGMATTTMTTMLSAKSATNTAAIAAAVKATHRSDANRARDPHRHPVETLTFFGVRPTDKVVELWPGGGWYTEILAPYLAARGTLTIASPVGKPTERIAGMLDANPAVFGKVKRANFPMSTGAMLVAPGSADVVLTFRNVHNWRFGGTDAAQKAFDQMFVMLRPGGTLGVEEHRLPEEMDSAREEKSGYMKKSSVIAFATKAGFKLVGESDINANPKDTHDWPKGVWTLPPNYAEGPDSREKFAAIGESDRMTLKFMKPRK